MNKYGGLTNHPVFNIEGCIKNDAVEQIGKMNMLPYDSAYLTPIAQNAELELLATIPTGNIERLFPKPARPGRPPLDRQKYIEALAQVFGKGVRPMPAEAKEIWLSKGLKLPKSTLISEILKQIAASKRRK